MDIMPVFLKNHTRWLRKDIDKTLQTKSKSPLPLAIALDMKEIHNPTSRCRGYWRNSRID